MQRDQARLLAGLRTVSNAGRHRAERDAGGLMSMSSVALNVGLPLWGCRPRPRRRAGRGPLRGQHGLAVLLQSRVSRRVRTYLGAARAQRLAGILLAACCACPAGSAFGGRETAVALLILAVSAGRFACAGGER
jgi:hypothetical protein